MPLNSPSIPHLGYIIPRLTGIRSLAYNCVKESIRGCPLPATSGLAGKKGKVAVVEEDPRRPCGGSSSGTESRKIIFSPISDEIWSIPLKQRNFCNLTKILIRPLLSSIPRVQFRLPPSAIPFTPECNSVYPGVANIP